MFKQIREKLRRSRFEKELGNIRLLAEQIEDKLGFYDPGESVLYYEKIDEMVKKSWPLRTYRVVTAEPLSDRFDDFRISIKEVKRVIRPAIEVFIDTRSPKKYYQWESDPRTVLWGDEPESDPSPLIILAIVVSVSYMEGAADFLGNRSWWQKRRFNTVDSVKLAVWYVGLFYHIKEKVIRRAADSIE